MLTLKPNKAVLKHHRKVNVIVPEQNWRTRWMELLVTITLVGSILAGILY